MADETSQGYTITFRDLYDLVKIIDGKVGALTSEMGLKMLAQEYRITALEQHMADSTKKRWSTAVLWVGVITSLVASIVGALILVTTGH
jgi:hypothetical protein